jgi:hypothetical protein
MPKRKISIMVLVAVAAVAGIFVGYRYGYVHEHAFFQAHHCHGVADGYICADGAVYK